MVESYPDLYETFRWHVPKGFNLASACCLQWSNLPSHEQRPALIHQTQSGTAQLTTFAELGRVSSQLANGLTRLGVIPGDRVVLILSSPSDTLAALLACWAVRAVAVPLKPGSNAELLLPQLKQARSQIALIDAANQADALAAIARCPRVKHIVGIDVYDGRVMSWRGLIARQPVTYVPVQSLPSDPALMVWPEHPAPELASQSAMVLAHQSLIGQLPGFVMATNWFPNEAKQLLTTLSPWDEAGLLTAILPALYFGHTVVLADRLPAPSEMPPAVTHVVTTGRDLLETLKGAMAQVHDSADSTVTADTTPIAPATVAGTLCALTVLEHTLDQQWREHAERAYGTNPNLATFVDGCGLLIAQSQHKWPEPAHSSGRLAPGHHARLAINHTLVAPEHLPPLGELEISRVDRANMTDPAQFIQAWPVKDALDLSAELPGWWRTGLSAHELEDNCWRIIGYTNQWQLIAGQPVSLWQLEQAVLLDPKVVWAEVALIPSRKPQPEEVEIWVLLNTSSAEQTQLKPWRQTMRHVITDRILSAANLTHTNIKVKVGLVNPQNIPTDADKHTRSPWHTRAYQAMIDFL